MGRVKLPVFMALALAALMVSPACKKDPKTGGPTKDPLTDAYRCQSDDECQVSCSIKGECCGQPCACTNVYHDKELDDMYAEDSGKCSGAPKCTMYQCPLQTHKTVAKCVANYCEVRQVALVPDPPAYPCANHSDCVVSCFEPNTCCFHGCDCTRVYHRDELKKYMDERQSTCAGKLECPIPDCPPMPEKTVAECDLQRGCVAKRVRVEGVPDGPQNP